MNLFQEMIRPIMERIAAVVMSHGVPEDAIDRDNFENKLEYKITPAPKGRDVNLELTWRYEEDTFYVLIHDSNDSSHILLGCVSIDIYDPSDLHFQWEDERPIFEHNDTPWFISFRKQIEANIGRQASSRPVKISNISIAYQIIGIMAEAMVEFEKTGS